MEDEIIMNKNVKRMFFVLTLIILLATVGAACAAEDADSTSAVDNSVSDATTISDSASDTVAAESVTTTSNENKVDAKTIEKEEKNIKTSTETIEVNNIDELTNTINNALNDAANEEYIINLNNGSYNLTSTIRFNNGQFSKNIIINANNQIFGTSNPNAYVFIQNNCNYTINNIILDQSITNNVNITFNNSQLIGGTIGNQNNANLTFINSYINSTINNYANLVIDDNTEFGNNTKLDGSGNLTINDYNKIVAYLSNFNGTFTIENTILSSQNIWNYGNITFVNVYFRPSQNIFNYANITFKNCTVECNINNNMNYDGIITISDDTIIANNISIQNRGTIIINDTSRILPLLTSYNGTYTFNNMNLSGKLNQGNLTLNECNITGISNYGNLTTNNCYYSSAGRILNYGQHIITNSTLNDIDVINYNDGNLFFNNCVLNCRLQNAGTVYLSEDTILGNSFQYSGNGVMICNDTSKIINYVSTLSGNNSISNITLNKVITNNGNLTITNCTLNSTITNNGNLTISDDTILTENFQIMDNGEIIINDTERLLPYMTTYNGNYTFDNIIFNREKTNNGNLTINNSLINNTFYNYGNLTLDNTLINQTGYQFYNHGNLTMNNSLVNKTVYNYQNMEMENSIINYTVNNNGNLTIRNTTNNQRISNNGNISMYDSVQNSQIQNNNGNLTITNSTLNSTITNNGNLTISDDTILTENFQITGNGQIIINDTNRLIPYMTTYNGNYTIENMTINSQKTNTGNLTIINSTINSPIINRGNLTIKNTTLNSTLRNIGTIIISDDTVFTENFQITGNGQIIINDTNRLIPYMTTYNGNYTFDNIIFNREKTNNGNLTIINSNITTITNNGNLTIINCTLNGKITNNINSNLIIINSTGNNHNIPIGNSMNSGGTILDNKANATIINSTFENNKISSSSDNGQNFVQGGALFNAGNLTIYNSSFKNNSACSGGAIASVDAQKLTINDCLFENNNAIDEKNYGNGRVYGGAIYCFRTEEVEINNSKFNYNNVSFSIPNAGGGQGGAIYLRWSSIKVINSSFENNYALVNNEYTSLGAVGGAIDQDIIMNQDYFIILNSTFKNNKVNSTSTWSSQSGSGGALAFNAKNVNILNNYFENNTAYSDQGVEIPEYGIISTSNGCGGAIYGGNEDNNIQITNNTFINCYSKIDGGAIFINGENIIINDNSFININSSSETIGINCSNIIITDNYYENCSIKYATFKLEGLDKIYSNEFTNIYIKINLTNPQSYDQNIIEKSNYSWYINGQNIHNNKTEMNVFVENETMITYVTPTISNKRSNLFIISPTLLNNMIITPENIKQYIFDGELIVNANSRLIFQGEFNNIGEIYNNKNEVIFDGTNATFTNTSFVIEANNNTIQNMNINNTDISSYIITNLGNNTLIRNNTLNQYNNQGKTAAIYNNNGNNNKITQNNIKVSGPALSITYEGGATTANTQGILSVGGQNNTITYNTITVTNSTDPEQSQFSTIEAITAPSGTNNNISYNTINCTGARFNYGINTLENVENNTITYNNITVTGYRYTNGIQVGNGANNNLIANNNINLTCLNTTPVDEAAISYGVIITSQGGSTADNNTITENTININGAVNYGMEIYTATNTNINNNNITLTGVKSMGIGYAHSPNSTVTDNIIITNDDSAQTLNGVTEEIQPASTGIKIQQDSENILIENNTITTNDKAKTDKTIDTTDTNTVIKNNQLTSSTGYGADTIKTTQTDTIIENNTIETTTSIEVPEIAITNTPITLTATVTDTNGNTINNGIISFTIGNEIIAQATVTDGIATTTATFTEEADTIIVAIYTPESSGLSTSNAEATITIQQPITNIEIADIELTAGETVTFTATVTDQVGNNINGGKVTFKVNGKTVKDANGKVVYAKVVDGVATVNYTVADNLAGKDVEITAVYSGYKEYESAKTNTTVTVNPKELTLTATATTTQLTATLSDNTINTGKIVFKINGKTVKDANGKVIYAKVTNGTVSVDYTLPESYKAGNYTVTATFIASGYDKLEAETTLTVAN